MALENSMLVMNGKQVGGNTQDLTGYQTKVDNNLETESKEIAGAINELRSEKADTDIVAADFNAGTSYTAGNYCIYDGKFYKFKASHSGAWSAADVDEIKIAGELSALKSGLINVNTIANQCSFDVKTIRATFNAQSKVVSFDVRSNDGFTASTWTPLLTISDASFAPSSTMFFPVVFINANRDEVVGNGVGKLDTNNIISVCPDDTIPAYSEAVGIVMWQ